MRAAIHSITEAVTFGSGSEDFLKSFCWQPEVEFSYVITAASVVTVEDASEPCVAAGDGCVRKQGCQSLTSAENWLALPEGRRWTYKRRAIPSKLNDLVSIWLPTLYPRGGRWRLRRLKFL